MRSRHRHHALAFALSLSCLGRTVSAQTWPQSLPDLPFAPGERLTYTGRVHVGVAGSGTIWVEGPLEVRGTPAWVLHSDMQGKLGPIRATETNTSWLDPMHMAALRYTSNTRHLWKKNDDVVEIFPQEHRWQSAKGMEGATTGDAPLDELSFLFFLRTLPLNADTTLVLARHFDVARNPTIVRVVGREDVEVGAGRFRAIVVEIRVRDARRYHGEGTIRIHLSDDRCRLLLRLESNVPDAGTATLALASYEGARYSCTARLPQ
jgi:hypothetical protein